MQTYFSADHALHAPSFELHGGAMVEPFERSSRIDSVLERLASRGFEAPRAPGELDMAPVRVVHDAGYLHFLETAWEEWNRAGLSGDVIANANCARRMPAVREPRRIDARAAYYALAADTAITRTTWRAASSSAASAVAAARHVAAGGGSAFALCRPPGHHAAIDMFGGYCFLNNAAIAAATLQLAGANRLAIIDVDFHHGNGTQDIFYACGDTLTLSIHGHPDFAYPYFSGLAAETGVGSGEGANANYPLSAGTTWSTWSRAFESCLQRVRAFGPDALIVALGVDTFEDDPISSFALRSSDYLRIGEQLGGVAVPTVFCMEGGYAVDSVGLNVVNVLEGFLSERAAR
ncbi:MAG: histone deacetylase family protein [Planctomycetes bacterium]|nr:histone deacetylase family protein [Planctomycetota bacterium]MCB9917588.1 histone deacetylase family protein [Planctomycetota bacterium]